MPDLLGRRDPFAGYNFRVDFIKFDPFFVLINATIQGGFFEVTGLQSEMNIHQYNEGGVNDYVHNLPGQVRYPSNVVLKKGLVDYSLWIWYQEMNSGNANNDRSKYRCKVLITLMDGPTKIQAWILKEAYPVKWIGPQMNAKQSAIAVETLELAHQGFMY